MVFHTVVVVASEVCTVELVGSIEVNGNTATYAFRGVGSDISRFICKLNGQFLPNCKLKIHGMSIIMNVISQVILS